MPELHCPHAIKLDYKGYIRGGNETVEEMLGWFGGKNIFADWVLEKTFTEWWNVRDCVNRNWTLTGSKTVQKLKACFEA